MLWARPAGGQEPAASAPPAEDPKPPAAQSEPPAEVSKPPAAGADRAAIVLDVQGPIGPATRDFITRSLETAATRGRARRHPHGHARRSRHLDARHHQGHPRLAGPGRHVRRAAGRARRQRRHLHPVREPRRGDGARRPTSARRRRSRSACQRAGGAGGTSRGNGDGGDEGSRRRSVRATRRPETTMRPSARRSTTPSPTSAASPSCAGATPTGPSARCAKR